MRHVTLRSGFHSCRWNRSEQSRPLSLLEPVTLSADVNRRGVVQQTVQDGSGDRLVSEHRAPVGVALIGGQDNAASLVARRDQLEEDRRADRVQLVLIY